MVPGFVKRWVRARRQLPTTPVYGLGPAELRSSAKAPRALLSYITRPFRITPRDPDNVRFSNIGIARGIVQTLNELGYVVDVAEWEDTAFVPERRYALFVGHGGINFERIARALGPETRRIYFSTGAYWRFHNEQELARVKALNERRDAALPPDRYIHYSEEWANENAEAIVCLGNESLRKTYGRFPSVRHLNNAAFPVRDGNHTRKYFAAARRNFLFFAGGGNVHKGLDLLLEVFSRVDAHLWICQLLMPEFARTYRRELEELANIHYVGWVPVRSPEFRALVERCAYTILPSCSEGCAGSVVECMHHGLIPVVSRESFVETSDYGITLRDCSIETIAQTVEELSQRPTGWLEEMSQQTLRAAESEFSESAFRGNLKVALGGLFSPEMEQRQA